MFFEQLHIGMSAALEPVAVEEGRMIAFAREFNPAPIHMDADYAAGTPFGKRIAPGMLSFLLVWERYIAADFFGEELIAGKSTKVEWDAPVFAGDVLTGHAEIIELIAKKRSGIAVLSLSAVNQNGETVLHSTTEAVVRRQKMQSHSKAPE